MCLSGGKWRVHDRVIIAKTYVSPKTKLALAGERSDRL
jgi:hypothetical protein